MGNPYNPERGITVFSSEVGDGTNSRVYIERSACHYYEISNNQGASLVKSYENFIHAQSPQNN